MLSRLLWLPRDKAKWREQLNTPLLYRKSLEISSQGLCNALQGRPSILIHHCSSPFPIQNVVETAERAPRSNIYNPRKHGKTHLSPLEPASLVAAEWWQISGMPDKNLITTRNAPRRDRKTLQSFESRSRKSDTVVNLKLRHHELTYLFSCVAVTRAHALLIGSIAPLFSPFHCFSLCQWLH